MRVRCSLLFCGDWFQNFPIPIFSTPYFRSWAFLSQPCGYSHTASIIRASCHHHRKCDLDDVMNTCDGVSYVGALDGFRHFVCTVRSPEAGNFSSTTRSNNLFNAFMILRFLSCSIRRLRINHFACLACLWYSKARIMCSASTMTPVVAGQGNGYGKIRTFHRIALEWVQKETEKGQNGRSSCV